MQISGGGRNESGHRVPPHTQLVGVPQHPCPKLGSQPEAVHPGCEVQTVGGGLGAGVTGPSGGPSGIGGVGGGAKGGGVGCQPVHPVQSLGHAEQSEQPPTAHCVLTPPHMQVVGIPHCPFWSPGELQPWAATNTESGVRSMSMATTHQRVILIPGDSVTDSFVRCGCEGAR